LPPLFIGLPLLLLLAFAVLSTVKAINPVKAVQAITHFGVCVSIFAIITCRPRDEGFYKKLFTAMILGATIVIISILILLSLVSMTIGPKPALTTRLTIFYQHPNFLAPYLAIMAIICLTMVATIRSKLLKLYLPIFMAMIIGALFLTDSRAGYAGCLVGIVICSALSPWVRSLITKFFRGAGKIKLLKSKKLWAAVLIIICITTIIALSSEKLISSVKNSTRLKRSTSYRLDAWSNSIQIIKNQLNENKLYGVGMDTFLSVKKFPPGSKFSHEITAPHPHNLFLYIAQSSGLPALLGFLLLIIGYLYCSISIIRKISSPFLIKITIGIFACFCTILVCSLADLGLSIVTLIPGPLWIFFGIISSIFTSRISSRNRSIDIGGLKAAIPAAAIILLTYYGAYLPSLGRLYLKKAELMDDHYRPDEADRLANLALTKDPLYRKAADFLLPRYCKNNSFDEANLLITTLCKLEPNNAELHHMRAKILMYCDQMNEAIKEFKNTVKIDHGSPNLPDYYASLIRIESSFGKKDDAIRDLKSAIKHNIAVINKINWKVNKHATEPRDDLFLEIADSDEIIKLEEILIELHKEMKESLKKSQPQDRFSWFSIYLAFKNAHIYDQALLILDDIESIWPAERAYILESRSNIAEAQKDKEKSHKFLSDAKDGVDETNPSSIIYYQIKFLNKQVEDGNFDEVIAKLEALISNLKDYHNFKKSFVMALESLDNALVQNNDHARRIDSLKKSYFFCSQWDQRAFLLADLAYSLWCGGHLDEAERTVAKALDFFSTIVVNIGQYKDDDFDIHLQRLANLLYDIYKDMKLTREESLRRAESALDLHSPKIARYMFYYYFLIKNGSCDIAQSALDIALTSNPLDFMLLEYKAECAHMMNDLDGLEKSYSQLTRFYQMHEKEIDEQCRILYTKIVDDKSDIKSIKKLVRFLSYGYKIDHCMNIIAGVDKFHGQDSELQLLKARLMRLNHNPERALKALKKSVELDPSNFKAATALKNLELKLSDPGADKFKKEDS